MTPTRIVILAAGQGKRMQSSIPKVLHTIGGKPLLLHVVETAIAISDMPPIVIYGHEGHQVRAALSHLNIQWVEQSQAHGTGHAVMQALPYLQDNERVLILYGDVPLISVETLKKFIEKTPPSALGLMTAIFNDPTGYGRIVKDAQGQVTKIIEEKDADEKIKLITEINTGIYCVEAPQLKKWLPLLSAHNAQGEYYLTDIITLAEAIHTEQPKAIEEVLGVNDRVQLNRLERFYQYEMAKKLMQQGVTLYDPHRFDVRGELIVGKDVVIDINAVFEGRVVIGDGCKVGPQVTIRDSQISDRVEIRANSVIDGASIAADCIIGPFARLRPGTILSAKAHIGNFVEIKNSVIDEGSKINHLSYIGDTLMGKGVNIGAGTITCNYDGMYKHQTCIEDHVSIGSGTQLIAPITIGKGATIGAGSTIRKNAPSDQLTLSVSEQKSIKGWQPRAKKPIQEKQ